MPDIEAPRALAPTLVADRFPRLGAELLALLDALAAADWSRPTVCPGWTVADLAAHLLDTALRRLAFERDHHAQMPETPISGDADLARLVDRLNASAVEVHRRLGPRLLRELLAWVEPQLQAHLSALDPWRAARFGVSWAGESSSLAWFDIAREYSERWHHQQQIRLAVGAPALVDPWFSRPLFDTLLRALPHRYRELDAEPGTTIAIEVRGVERYVYTLAFTTSGWSLSAGEAEHQRASVALDEETAWLLLTNGIGAAAAGARAKVVGEHALAAPFFATRAVILRDDARRA